MAGEYQLSYTGPQVNEKLGKIDGLAQSVNNIPSIYETITSAEAREKELKELIGSGGYVLPTASANTKGGVKIGDGLTISGEVLSYTLPTASASTLGGIKIGNGLLISNGVVSVDIINNLNSASTTSALSANQGKVLNETITELKNSLSELGYGDMLREVYDSDEDGVVDNAKTLDGYAASYFLTVNNPTATGYFSLNRFTDDTSEIGDFSVSMGYDNAASASYAFAEGVLNEASGIAAHAEGNSTTSSGAASHSEGNSTTASGDNAHAEGNNTKALGICAHVEGKKGAALGHGAHAEGVSTSGLPDNITSSASISDILTSWNSIYFLLAKAEATHAEGFDTLALNQSAHAEGYRTIASGAHSHTEGYFTQATGQGAHAEGLQTIAEGEYQHVQGKYNISDTTSVFIIGNGTASNARSNIFTIDSTGNAWTQGDIYIGSTSGTNKDEGSKKLITFDEIPTNISAFTNDSNYVTETGLAAKGFLTSESDPTVPDWAKAATKPSYSVDEITNALSSTLLNAANGIATLDANRNLKTNEGITSENKEELQIIDSQENVIAQIDDAGIRAINIYTVDKEFTKDDEGNVIETTYNLNYELAKLKAFSQIQIANGSYIGTGNYGSSNKNSIDFDFSPKFVAIMPNASGNWLAGTIFIYNQTINSGLEDDGNIALSLNVEWNETGLSWYTTSVDTEVVRTPSEKQLNASGVTYYYFAIGTKE